MMVQPSPVQADCSQSQVHFLPSVRLDFPLASTGDALAAGKKYEDLEIESRVVKKSQGAF